MRFLLAVLALGFCVSLPAQVVINEFNYDDSGTDDREFVELYNAGSTVVDISNWMLEGLDEAYPSDNNADYIIPPGSMIPAGGFFTIGSSNLPVNYVVGTTDLWENGGTTGGETILLRDAAGNIVDSVAYETNKQLSIGAVYPNQFTEGFGLYGNFTSIDSTMQSWSRWTDGLDTNDNGRDFGILPLTLGASNNITTSVVPYIDDFNSYGAGATVPNWLGSFVTPRAVDPTVISADLPNVLGASPDGGNCLVCWDPAGGGDMGTLVSAPTTNFELECYVYVFAGHTGIEIEAWSIGVRGTTGSFYNIPILFPSNGNTGVCWTLVSDGATSANMYLVDEGTGGPDNILLTVPITQGVNDGWQRLRLKVTNCVVEANFGGTYGNPASGVAYTGTTSTTGNIGQVYLGYREGVTGVVNARPLAIDLLQVVTPATDSFGVCMSQPFGSGSLQIDNFGLISGNEVFNVFTINEPCPGGVGTGPYAGLCTANFAATILPQILEPLGNQPFHFLAFGSTSNFIVPPGLIPVGLHLEAAGLQIGPMGAQFAPVAVLDTN